jgi:hypothetical protein
MQQQYRLIQFGNHFNYVSLQFPFNVYVYLSKANSTILVEVPSLSKFEDGNSLVNQVKFPTTKDSILPTP